METLARVTQLGRRFGRHQALSEVDLYLERGEVLGLLGPNGAGKTTCLRLLCGTLAPTSGHIEIRGIDLHRRPREARRHLGYLPERPPLYPELRVDEYLAYCARLHCIPRRQIPAALDEAKHRCGLDGVGRHLIATLSKGFRQRLGIAQAIIHRPAMLILDEPTEGLDPFQMRQLRELIRELAKESGVILSSHLLPEVQAVCDRVLILHDGRIKLNASLAADLPTNVWRVRLGADGDADRLKGLRHVIDATRIEADRYRVDLDERSTSADLAREILGAGLDLLELIPERSDLERVFFDLLGVEEDA